MMEYFTSGGENDNFSLQDMIESDMKTEFSEHLSDVASGGDFDHIFASLPEPIMSVPMSVSSEATSASTLEESVEMSAAAASGADIKLSDLGWLQTVNLAAIKPENTDPNLLVNPQTGLPVTTTGTTRPQTQTLASARQLTTASVHSGAAPDSIIQSHQPPTPVHAQIQIINQPMSPMSPAAVNSPMSPLSPTMTQVTTQPQTARQQNISLTLASTPLQPIHNTQVNNTNTQPLATQLLTTATKKVLKSDQRPGAKVYPKPVYSYSCLIAMALKNSDTGALPVAEIYNFMTENFPYFKTAPDGWKNSVRHNLSLNKCFEKIENPRANGNSRKGCLWGLNPAKIEKMDEEIVKWRKKDPITIKRSMAKPEVLEILEKGNIGSHSPRHPNNVRAVAMEPTTLNLTATTTITPVCSVAMATQQQNQALTTALQANGVAVNMIEVKPVAENHAAHLLAMKQEVKMEENATETGLSSDDLAIIDTALNLDPSLTDINLQNNIWDDINSDGLTLDDLPISSASALNISLTNGLSAQAASAGGTNSPLISLLTSGVSTATPPSGVITGRSLTPTSALTAASRTIFAQT